MLWGITQKISDTETASVKYLLKHTQSNLVIECALVHFARKNKTSVCTSVQKGCNLQCVFCATTYTHPCYTGNLTATEIIQQLQTVLTDNQTLWTNSAQKQIVFEGHGEPALNFNAVLETTQWIHNNLPQTQVKMVSCCPGNFLNKIHALPQNIHVPQLRISLHTTNNTLRRHIMPATKQNTVEKLINRAIAVSEKYQYKITLNFMVFANNCNNTEIKKLVKLVKNNAGNFAIRLIPLNPVSDNPLQPVNSNMLNWFYNQLKNNLPQNFETDLHTNFGRETNNGFACGQLRAYNQKQPD